MSRLQRWVHARSHQHGIGHAQISRQRRAALWMTIFAAVRTVAWIICMMLIAAHWLGVGGRFLHGFIALSGSVVFVTFISFYCNASTDAANLMAGIAALFSADSHATAIAGNAAVSADFAFIEDGIARLAGLHPGPEATELAAEIRRKLAGGPQQGGTR